jgi:hypothetical protein
MSQQGLVDEFVPGGFGRQSDDDPAVDERGRSFVDPQVFPFLAPCLDSPQGSFGVDAGGQFCAVHTGVIRQI